MERRRPVYYQRVQRWVLERWMLVAYLIINEMNKEALELIRIEPDQRLYETVQEYMNLYISEGKTPPAAIAPAIMNMADDYMAGRAIEMRAGDYISLQNYMRNQG